MHECLGLREAVRQQCSVQVKMSMRGPERGNEIDRDQIGALMEHLKVGVLAIGADSAPDHGRGTHGDRLTITRHSLAITLHFQLLQVARQ